MIVYARSRSSGGGSGSKIWIKTDTSYKLNRIELLWNFQEHKYFLVIVYFEGYMTFFKQLLKL